MPRWRTRPIMEHASGPPLPVPEEGRHQVEYPDAFGEICLILDRRCREGVEPGSLSPA